MAGKRVGQSAFSWPKLFIILLVIASMVGAVIIGYLAFTHQLSPIVGAVSFIAIVALFIWLITVLRKSSMHYHTPSFILVFLVLIGIMLVCAFAGVEPLVGAKDKMLSIYKSNQSVNSTITQNNDNVSENGEAESFQDKVKINRQDIYYIQEMQVITKSLNTIESWEGSESTILEFTTNKSPVVVNGTYTATSTIASTFEMFYQGGINGPKIGSVSWSKPFYPSYLGLPNNMQTMVLEGIGTFRLKVTAAAAEWQIKVGQEGTSTTGNHTVTGETSFQTLLSWGIPAKEIETVIGGKLPTADTTIHAYFDKGDTISDRYLFALGNLQRLADRYK